MASRLPPVVKSLGAVSFFNDLASEMVYPLIPALVTRTLGAGAVALGVLDGLSEAAASLAKLGAGWLADRPDRRRPMVLLGYAIATVTRPVMAITGAAWQVVALRTTDRLGKGLRTPPRDALIADATPPSIRGRAFGFHRAMDHAGAVVGPLLASVLLAVGVSVPGVFLWSVVPGVAAVLVVAWALRAGKGGTGKGEGDAPPPVSQPPTRARAPNLLVLLVVGFAFARLPETLLLLRLQDLALPVALAPIVWAGLHIVRSAGSYPGGWLTDSLGPGRAMALGWLIYAGVMLGLGTAGSSAAGVAWFLAFGLVAAATESAERALVAAAGGLGRRGRAFGIYHASVGLAALPGGLLFGALYSQAGPRTAFGVSAVLCLALCVAFVSSTRSSE